MASAAEQEIRDAVVERLRVLQPDGRIIHELNIAGTGSNRIDVASVTRDRITAVEIKSERDVLKRLQHQWDSFNACCHRVLIVCHRKHFEEHRPDGRRADLPPDLRLKHELGSGRTAANIWCYPEPELPMYRHHGIRGWIDPDSRYHTIHQEPRAATMLDMLWREELSAECGRHLIAHNARSTRPGLISAMVWNMTGREICHAVCRQLRQRQFNQADEPIIEAQKT